MSGTGIPLAAAAAIEGVPSVQALRKRIKKGTLRSVRVVHRDSIVVGVELEELARRYPAAFEREPATTDDHPCQPKQPGQPEQPAGIAGQPGGASEQPGGAEEPRSNPPEGATRRPSTPAPDPSVAPNEQPEAPHSKQPESRGSQELQTVDVAIQGWREAREALETGRREHREEITRTVASYEQRLQAVNREREQALELHGVREARAVRWGRAAAGALVATLAMGLWLTDQAGERLATERFEAGTMTQQRRFLAEENTALEQAMEAQGAALSTAREALDEAEARAEALRAERGTLEQELQAVLAERERAREATRAALRAMGSR